MVSENIKSTASLINIRKVGPVDFNPVADLYYRYLSGDFVGSCGRYVFLNYLRYLSKIHEGSLMCAVTKEQRVVGFAVGMIDRQRINKQWLRRIIILLVPLLTVKFLFSRNFRTFLINRFRDKRKGGGGFTETSSSNENQIRAYSMWAVVDESYRGEGNELSVRLLTAIEKDVKDKGATQIYSFVNSSNLASIFMHMKNGWKVIDKNKKRLKLSKAL